MWLCVFFQTDEQAMLEDTQVALLDLETVTFHFRRFNGEPLVASECCVSVHHLIYRTHCNLVIM